jgi:tetratricopeptide (TPR) repeat protein
VGRAEELGTLAAIVEQGIRGRTARAALVTAEGGLGKSRLAQELVSSLSRRQRDVEIWSVRAEAAHAGSPLGLLAHLIRGALGMESPAPLEKRRALLRTRIGERVSPHDLARLVEFVGELIGVPAAEPLSTPLRCARRDPFLLGDHIRRACADLIAQSCERRPLLVIIDDAHAADAATLSFCDALLRQFSDLPLALIVLGRSEVQRMQVLRSETVAALRLPPLAEDDAERLVRHVLGSAASTDSVAFIVARGGGNPLCLEELVRAAADGSDAPDSVHDSARTRLERVPAGARSLLGAASVLGQSFSLTGLCALTGGAATDLFAPLTELEASEILVRNVGTETRWMFGHSLLREAAYAAITLPERVTLHRRAADWMEASGSTDVAALADHAERAGERARAARWWLRAAEQGLAGNDFEAALAHVARGVACGAGGEDLARLRLCEAEAHEWREQNLDVARCAAEAMSSARACSSIWMAALAKEATAALTLGHHDRLITLAEQLPRLPRKLPTPMHVVTTARMAALLLRSGRPDLAEPLYDDLDSLDDLAVALKPEVRGWIDHALAWRALFDGDIGAALMQDEASGDSFELAGDLRNACQQQAGAAYELMEMGAYAEAERSFRSAIAHAERLGLESVSTMSRHNLGLVLAHSGKLDEARELELQAAAVYAARGNTRKQCFCNIYLSIIEALAGDAEAAEAAARWAVSLAQDASLRSFSLAVLSQALLVQGRVDEALEQARAAVALLDGGTVEEGESRIRLAHAEALEAKGLHAEARRAIARARARLLERAGCISDLGLRGGFLWRVAENAYTLALARQWLGEERLA